MTRLVPILRCVKNRASRDVSGPDAAKVQSRTRTTSRPLNFFLLRIALGSLSPDIKTRDACSVQHDEGGPEVLRINVKLVSMYSYYHRFVLTEKLQSHENRDTKTAKWARCGLPGSGPRVAANIFCPCRAIPRRVLCDLFPRRAEITRARRGHGARRGYFDDRGSR